MTISRVVLAAAIGVFFLPQTTWAQQTRSLAEVARREEARQKTVTKPSKTYTNEDLARVSRGTAAPAPAPATAPAATTAARAAGDETAGAAAEDSEEPERDEDYWRSRITTARTQLARSQLFLEGLQTRANSLATDFVNRDDPAQRAVIERDRQDTLREIDRLTKEVKDLQQEIADIQEEARRAGVPPGWLR